MAAGGFRHALPQSGIPIGEVRPRRPPSESESGASGCSRAPALLPALPPARSMESRPPPLLSQVPSAVTCGGTKVTSPHRRVTAPRRAPCPPDPRVPVSPPPALPGGHHYPRPVPLSVLGGPATCFSGRPGGAYGNSWRELNADVGGFWSCVFCLIGGRAAGVPGTLRAGQRTQLGAANVTTRGEGSRRGAWMRAPKGVEGEVRSLG